MNIKSIAALCAVMTLPLNAAAQSPTNSEARSYAKQFVEKLQPELKKGMQAGGPVNAISVCHSKAPQIAHDMSQASGWNINRVSLKPRGAGAKPDAWEKEVMMQFDQQLAKGADIKTLEFSQVVIMNGEKQFRYMKAIPTGEVCLKCHGTDVQAPVKEAIQKYYPQDKATGFSAGQMRGAFSFTKAL